MKSFDRLAISDSSQLVFGTAPYPVRTRHGLEIGGGSVYPELNFTLPQMTISVETMPEVRRQYEEIITGSMQRAVELDAPGVVIEFETLPPMCENPSWAIDLAKILLEGMEKAHASSGLRSVLRMTPNDLREMTRPPLMRSGPFLENTLRTFEGAAAAGAELLSIESVGGKELNDDYLLQCDLGGVLFALTVLGVRDMRFLWTEIVKIATRFNAIPAGDTACGFGNTAMVLAEKKYIPRVFAAVVRAVSAVRSLVAYEYGAVGPGKDCGYENPFLKAITGFPMAMEGKTSACAHLSPVGNVAAATCDTWSNESVQNFKLLGAMAPVCSMEQLSYDCRLMNTASQDGSAAALQLRDWLSRSDAYKDPQALILAPQNVITISRAIVAERNHYAAGTAAAHAAIEIIRAAHREGALVLPDREVIWLDLMEGTLAELPSREEQFIARMLSSADPKKYLPAEYGL
jgi:methanol--5-hydroxybenzimidazolylcobamide Co-methyltransferase